MAQHHTLPQNAAYRDRLRNSELPSQRPNATNFLVISTPERARPPKTIENVHHGVHILLRFVPTLEPPQPSDNGVTTRPSQPPAGIGGKMSAALFGVYEILYICVAMPMIRNEARFCSVSAG